MLNLMNENNNNNNESSIETNGNTTKYHDSISNAYTIVVIPVLDIRSIPQVLSLAID